MKDLSRVFQGDDPPRDRTSELRVRGFRTRHLGPVQMTTDTALGVTKLVVHDKIPLKEIPYIVSAEDVGFFISFAMAITRFLYLEPPHDPIQRQRIRGNAIPYAFPLVVSMQTLDDTLD